MTDEQIYTQLKKSKTVASFLGLENETYPITQLVDMSEIFFPQQSFTGKNALPKRIRDPKIKQSLVVGPKSKTPITLDYSDDGEQVLAEDRGAMERCLALLPQMAFDDTVTKSEKALSDFDIVHTIVSAKYLDIDEYFPFKVFDFELATLKSLLKYSETFSEKEYGPEEAISAPIDTLDDEAAIARIRQVIAKKFRVEGSELANKIKSKKNEKNGIIKISCPGFVSAHRTAAVIMEAVDKATGQVKSWWVSCFDVEMAGGGTINLVGDDGGTAPFFSDGLNSGANFAFGGEAGDHTSSTGGSMLLRKYDTEEAALAAVTSRPTKPRPMTQPAHIYVEDTLTPETAKQLVARQLLIKDYPTGIYSDYPLVSSGYLPANNCGTIVQEQRAVAGLTQNVAALAIPTGPDGTIQIPYPKVAKNDPDYWLLKAIASGLNAQYAVQWAEGTFAAVQKEQTVKVTGTDAVPAKALLKGMFVDAYFGLHAAAMWQELFSEAEAIEDSDTKAAIKALLKSGLGQLALLRPTTHVFNIVKATLSYEEFLSKDDTHMIDVIKSVRKGTVAIATPSAGIASEGTVALYDPNVT
ncbi:MAG: hypothetical protein COB93_11880 [Sneathiella sp.]|nr:MAG: hypothetical protein COB93_11880 [Sneathiella sp.]